MSATARALLAPPLLWSAHFLVVYVFVSLACLWHWHRLTLLGLPLVEVTVALLTLAFLGAVLLSMREAARLDGFARQVGMGVGVLFLAATAMVGLPTLLAPACR